MRFSNWLLTLGALLIPLSALSAKIDCDQHVHVDCGKTPSALMDASGDLLVVFVQDQHVYLSRSADLGESYSEAVEVNAEPMDIYANGENRPKIALGSEGEIYVSWTEKTGGRFTGDIRFSRSVDGGKSFSEPLIVNNDGLLTSHRFDDLRVTASGAVFVSWLDKRDQMATREAGGEYTGAALYYAVSTDSGKSFASNYRVADHSCECCRIASAPHDGDKVAVAWRHIFGDSVRDHGYALLTADGQSEYGRATEDNWQINACPHHGPHMAAAGGDSYHLVWFSNGTENKGIAYALLDIQTGANQQFLTVDNRPGASHPQVAKGRGRLHIAWKFFDGERTRILARESSDDGRNWSEPRELAQTSGNSDHPQLLAFGERTYLAWHTAEEGYRVIAVR